MNYPSRKSNRSPWSKRKRRTWGFTLAETVVSIGMTGTLLGGMVSVMSIASLAAYNNTGIGDNTCQAGDVVSQITTDLSLAQAFTERSSTVADFIVPDRDGDGLSESIRYEWSGGAGGTLTRRYNRGRVVTIAKNVHHFNLGYITKVVQPPPPDPQEEDVNAASLGDTTIWQGRHASTNFGGATVMKAWVKDDRTALIGFDLSGATYTVGSVTLRLFVISAEGSAKISVYPMIHTANNASWYEGTSDDDPEDGAACEKYRSYQSSGSSVKWEDASGSGKSSFFDILGPEIGSIDPGSYSANTWIEIPLDAAALEQYRALGSISLNVQYNADEEIQFASKENAGGNGPELIISAVDSEDGGGGGGSDEPQESDVYALIEHDNAPGGEFIEAKLTNNKWAAQYFKPTLPANTQSWKITGVRVSLKKDRGSDGVISLQIRDADANQKPGSTVLTQTTIKESDLEKDYEWVWTTANFSPAGELNPADGFCLVVAYESGGGTIGKVQGEKDGSPMTANSHAMITSNGGNTWGGPQDTKDLRFTVFGTVTTVGDP